MAACASMPLAKQRLSVAEVAQVLDVTEAAVRRALREGRLRRCNSAYERPLFELDEVKRFVAVKGTSIVAVNAGDRPLSVKEVAHHVGISECAVRKALRVGRLRRCNALRDSRALFDIEEVKRFAFEHETGAGLVARQRERALYQRALRLASELHDLLPELRTFLAGHTKEESPQ